MICFNEGKIGQREFFILKVLKYLGIELEQEDLSGLKNPVNQLREATIPLIIEAVAQKELDADPSS